MIMLIGDVGCHFGFRGRLRRLSSAFEADTLIALEDPDEEYLLENRSSIYTELWKS
jgi:hypothetical protein